MLASSEGLGHLTRLLVIDDFHSKEVLDHAAIRYDQTIKDRNPLY